MESENEKALRMARLSLNRDIDGPWFELKGKPLLEQVSLKLDRVLELLENKND